MNTVEVATIVASSCATALMIVATHRWHGRWTGDVGVAGSRKAHQGSPPRIGIFPLWVGVAIGFVLVSTRWGDASPSAGALLLAMVWSSFPVVALGLGDDLTKRVSPALRLMGAAAAAALATGVLGHRIVRVDIPLVDDVLMFTPFSLLLTMVVVCGFTNAMNIVDGLHGLAGGLTLSMLLTTALVAHRLNDPMMVELCVVMASAVAGLLLVNFPRGLIFLGDGGAYFLGFMQVQLWLLLMHRHAQLTPWLFLGIGAYPTIETVFSIYRRRFRNRRGKSAMLADRLHLHCLAYRRRARHWIGDRARHAPWLPNAACAATLAFAGSLPALAAAQAPTSPAWQACVVTVSTALYVTGFRRLIVRTPALPGVRRRFRVPSAKPVQRSELDPM